MPGNPENPRFIPPSSTSAAQASLVRARARTARTGRTSEPTPGGAAASPPPPRPPAPAEQPEKGAGKGKRRDAEPETLAKRRLAASLRRVRDATGYTKDVTVCAALNETLSRAGRKTVTKSSFSRYMHGWHVPSRPVVEELYRLAERRCPAGTLSFSLGELLALRDDAATTTVAEEKARHESARLKAEIRRLREQQSTGAGPAAPGPGQNGGGLTAARATIPGQQNTQVTGPARVARARQSHALPVGGNEGDRQAAASPETRRTRHADTGGGDKHRGSTQPAPAPAAVSAEPAARRTAAHLVRRLLERTERSRSPDGAALSLLLDISGSMTPDELSEATRLLHSADQEVLADSLVTAFARQQEERNVILAALALQLAREDRGLCLLLSTAARRQR